MMSVNTSSCCFFIILGFSFLSHLTLVVGHTTTTKPIISFCTGAYAACAVFDSKKMKCWGCKNAWGLTSSTVDLLGDVASELGDSIPYINVGTNVGINEVACGSLFICLKLDTGDLKCLGYNGLGQVGIGVSFSVVGEYNGLIGDNLPVVNLGTGLQAIQMALGAGHSCFIVTGSKVKCVGWNDRGQLGLGDTTNRGSSPSDMGNSLNFVDLGTGVESASIYSASSASHNCIILSKPVLDAQKIKCWGSNDHYQLGYGDQNNRGDVSEEMGDLLPFVDLGIESKVQQIMIGNQHTCALLVTNNLKCFGYGARGQLGSGSNADIFSTGASLPDVLIDPGKTAKFLSGGEYYTCIVYDDQLLVKCIGDNTAGQLGQGDTTNRGNSPTNMIPSFLPIKLGTGSVKISSLHSGYLFICLVFEDNTVKCIGDNTYGQLAIGSTNNIGDTSSELGNGLPYAILFSPTQSPTNSPTFPTFSPTGKPSASPTRLPTSSPTIPCDYQSAKICKYDLKCIWKNVNGVKKCVMFDCITLNKSKCGKQRKRCKWNKKTSFCEFKIK